MFTGPSPPIHPADVVKEEIYDFTFETEEEDDDEDMIQLDNQSWKCGICGKIFDLECTAINHVVAHRSLPGLSLIHI